MKPCITERKAVSFGDLWLTKETADVGVALMTISMHIICKDSELSSVYYLALSYAMHTVDKCCTSFKMSFNDEFNPHLELQKVPNCIVNKWLYRINQACIMR